MHIDELHRYLDRPAEAEGWLRSWGLENTPRAHGNLVRLADRRRYARPAGGRLRSTRRAPAARPAIPTQHSITWSGSSQAARNPLSLASLFERDRESLPILLQIFATSQHLSDVLITDSESYDLLRITEGQPVKRDDVVREFMPTRPSAWPATNWQ